MKTDAATLKRVYAMSLAGVYPHYVAKAEKKGRTKAEVDEIIRWLTGYTQKQLESILEKRTNIETFIAKAKMNPSRTLVTWAFVLDGAGSSTRLIVRARGGQGYRFHALRRAGGGHPTHRHARQGQYRTALRPAPTQSLRSPPDES